MDIPLFKVHMPAGVESSLTATLHSGQLAQGARVAEFETLLRNFLGTDRVCATSDASGAITLALFLCGVRPGDEVIASPMSCLATTIPIANLFARPVWCDVDPATGMLDANRLVVLLSPRTRAILVHHWSGNVAALAALRGIAKNHGIKLVADASEAFGAETGGTRLGAADADFTVYSFSAVRHITTGEGGALVASTPEEFEAACKLRHYGIDRPNFRLPDGDLNPESDISVAGFNFAMTDVAATLGVAQMPFAERILLRHRENGRFYDAALADVPGISLLRREPETDSAYWTYSLRAERRAGLMRKLLSRGIGCQRLHLRNDRYTCFAEARRDGALVGVDLFDADNISIPCGWWVSEADRERIAECLRSGW